MTRANQSDRDTINKAEMESKGMACCTVEECLSQKNLRLQPQSGLTPANKPHLVLAAMKLWTKLREAGLQQFSLSLLEKRLTHKTTKETKTRYR